MDVRFPDSRIAFFSGKGPMGRGGGAHRSMKSLNAGDSSVRDSGHRLGRLPASFDSSSDMCVGAGVL